MRATDVRRQSRTGVRCVAIAAIVLAHPVLAPAVPAQASRDHAEIPVIENRAPAWTAATQWRFSETPRLQIGSVSGDSTLLLNRTRHATRLSDGRIAIAQLFEIRVYSAAGKHLRTIGRPGQGPGEFAQGISGLVALPGDSLAVLQQQRVIIFDPAGKYIRSVPTGRPGLVRDHRGGLPVVLLPDATALLILYDHEPKSWQAGIIRPRRGFVRMRGGGERVDTAGFFPGLEQVVYAGGSRPDSEARPFARSVYVAAGGDRLYIGDSEHYAIRAFSLADLRPILEIRRDVAPTPVDAALRTTWTERRRVLGLVPANRREAEGSATERGIARADFPRTLPYFASLLVDRTGNLWVRERPPGLPGSYPAIYTVFDRSGRLLGSVTIPLGVGVLEIGPDYMIGLWYNSDDVEFVRLYSLIKP